MHRQIRVRPKRELPTVLPRLQTVPMREVVQRLPEIEGFIAIKRREIRRAHDRSRREDDAERAMKHVLHPRRPPVARASTSDVQVRVSRLAFDRMRARARSSPEICERVSGELHTGRASARRRRRARERTSKKFVMGASFEESVIALKSMFPDVSEVVVRTTLEARDGHMESAVEKLLAMSRRGGGGHGGKDYGQSGLGAPGAMGMSPGAYDGRNGCVR